VTRAGGGFQLPGQIGATKGFSSKAYRTPPISDVRRVFACSVTGALCEGARAEDDGGRAARRARAPSAGGLISRERATQLAFDFSRRVRDRCVTWPSRVGPQLVARFEIDATALTVDLDEYMRELLTELAEERCTF
jgi:hypothetical protein